MTIKIKHLLISLAIIGLGIGIYFFVQYEIKLRNTVGVMQYGQLDIINFIHQEFPDQVKAYIEAQQKSLPASATTK